MTPRRRAAGYEPSVWCIKGCGRQRQSGKDRMCCRCWREANGMPPWVPGRRPRGVLAGSPLAVGAGQTGETLTVTASKADPLAEAWAELQASGVPPDPLLVEDVEDVPNTAPKVGGSRCQRCRLRWPQQYGLCRLCAQELAAADGYSSVRLYLEAMHATREAAKVADALRVELVPRPVVELEADGVAYVVESSSVRPLAEGELERELAAARNPQGWAAGGSPWSRTRKRPIKQ
jgi:hypothetical protein